MEQLQEHEKSNSKKKKTINQLIDITNRLQNTVDLSVIVLQQVMRNLNPNNDTTENFQIEREKKFQINPAETNEAVIFIHKYYKILIF